MKTILIFELKELKTILNNNICLFFEAIRRVFIFYDTSSMNKRKYAIQLENYDYYSEYFSERNYNIIKDYNSSLDFWEIANKYNLSRSTIWDIIREIYFIIKQLDNLSQNKKDY